MTQAYIIREAVKGLEYLHSVHLLHRDVKGHNVLFSANADVKLCDFGVSATLNEKQGGRTTAIGTPYVR